MDFAGRRFILIQESGIGGMQPLRQDGGSLIVALFCQILQRNSECQELAQMSPSANALPLRIAARVCGAEPPAPRFEQTTTG